MNATKKRGWGQPSSAQKYHYFPGEGDRSLCRKWGFFFGEVFDTNDESHHNCAECKRKVKALRESEASQ